MKAGSICTNCIQLQHNHSMNDRHIRNTSLISNTTTINNKSTNILPNLLANSTLPLAKQITQSVTSHSSTFSDKLVSDFKPVSDCSQCNDKSRCRHCRYVKVGNTCTNRVLLQHSHCMNIKHNWSTSLMSNTTTINNETTNVPPYQMACSTPQSSS